MQSPSFRRRFAFYGLITYGIVGYINWIAINSQNGSANILQTALLWPIYRPTTAVEVSTGSEELFLSVTLLQLLIIFTYLLVSFISYGVYLNNRASDDAKEYLQNPAFKNIISSYLGHKVSKLKEDEQLDLDNYRQIIDEEVFRDMPRLAEFLEHKGFDGLHMLTLEKVLRYASAPMYEQIGQSLKDLYHGRDTVQEMSLDEIERLR